MSNIRSPSLPGVPQSYQANDATTVKPPRILPGAMSRVYAELRDGRVVIGHAIGDVRHASVSFSASEWRTLLPMLRDVTNKTKETP